MAFCLIRCFARQAELSSEVGVQAADAVRRLRREDLPMPSTARGSHS